MKRDPELIRNILLHVEGQPLGTGITSVDCEGYDKLTIGEHVRLLEEAGYIEAEVSSGTDCNGINAVHDYIIWRLLNPGHDFIANAKNEPIWRKTMNLIRDKGSSDSLPVIQGIMTQVALKHFGLG